MEARFLPEVIGTMPKVELHVHLEGAFTYEFLFGLIQKYGGEERISSVDELSRRFVFRDFAHFIETWFWKNRFFRSPADFEESARLVLKNLSDQNVIYAEAFFSPWDFVSNGLRVEEITEATISGMKSAEREFPIRCGLIADIVRDYGAEAAEERVRQMAPYLDRGVIGIGLGGNERDFPPELFQTAFRTARQLGFRTTVHAGEASGPASVWNAVTALEAERIGHGVRASEDHRLLEVLKEKQIPLEVCITSNLKTGVYSSVEEHPFDRMFKDGLMLTVNSDDPSMFGSSITDEFALLVNKLGYSEEDLIELTLNAVGSSFLPIDDKRALIGKIFGFWLNGSGDSPG
ncbi:MAG: adenosine deaminase [Bacteroidetes bacterium]|jgi:adenosine deaminase|nr:adenosine deaminase [Bacteroidota bacterium]